MGLVELDDRLSQRGQQGVQVSLDREELARDDAGPHALEPHHDRGPRVHFRTPQALDDIQNVHHHGIHAALGDIGLRPYLLQLLGAGKALGDGRGQDDDGDVRKLGILRQVTAELAPIHHGHDQVRDDEIRRMAPSLL